MLLRMHRKEIDEQGVISRNRRTRISVGECKDILRLRARRRGKSYLENQN